MKKKQSVGNRNLPIVNFPIYFGENYGGFDNSKKKSTVFLEKTRFATIHKKKNLGRQSR